MYVIAWCTVDGTSTMTIMHRCRAMKCYGSVDLRLIKTISGCVVCVIRKAIDFESLKLAASIDAVSEADLLLVYKC